MVQLFVTWNILQYMVSWNIITILYFIIIKLKLYILASSKGCLKSSITILSSCRIFQTNTFYYCNVSVYLTWFLLIHCSKSKFTEQLIPCSTHDSYKYAGCCGLHSTEVNKKLCWYQFFFILENASILFFRHQCFLWQFLL